MLCLSFQIGVITVATTVDIGCLMASSEYARFSWNGLGQRRAVRTGTGECHTSD